jgi:hypothetical protein
MAKPYVRPESLYWLIPILVACGICVVMWFKPSALKDQLFFPVLIAFGLIAPIGGLWAIYQSIRYENSPLKYVAIVVLIPFGFLWYYFERYKKRVSTPVANVDAPGTP